MKEKTNRKKEHIPWHSLLSDMLLRIIDPEDFVVYAFEKLGTMPLESDFIIVRKNESGRLKKAYPDLEFMFPYMKTYTVIEYKSPEDRLTFGDFDKLRAYIMLVKEKFKITFDKDIVGLSLVSGFQKGYKEYIEGNGYEFREIEAGIFGHSDSNRHFYWIDLTKIGKKDPANFVNLFSANIKKYSNQKELSDIRNFHLFYNFYKIIYEKERDMTNIELRQDPDFMEFEEYMTEKFLESLPLDKVLSRYKPEEVLSKYKSEEVLSRYKPEEVLSRYKPEEVLSRYKPEEVLSRYKPEERLAGLNSEEIKKLSELLKRLENEESPHE